MSIFIVALLAFVDAKDRIEELDEVAANTPSQIEMNQTIDNAKPSAIKKDIDNMQTDINKEGNKLHEQINQNSSKVKEKFDTVKEHRKNITNPMN